MEFSQGDRVKHPARPEWGVGKVLDNSGGNLRIFFVGAGEKILKMGYVNLIKLDEGEAIHPVLDNLKTVKKDRGVKYRSLPLLIDNFLRVFPDGFYGNEYHDRERDYKMEAHKLLHETLNESVFSSLLKAGDYAEIHRRALKIVGKTNLIFPNEIMSLNDGLKITGNESFSRVVCSICFSAKMNLRVVSMIFPPVCSNCMPPNGRSRLIFPLSLFPRITYF